MGSRRPTVAARNRDRTALVQAGRGGAEAPPQATTPMQRSLLHLVTMLMALALSPGAENSYDTGTTHWFNFITLVWGDPSQLLQPTDWVLAAFAAWLGMVYVQANGRPLAHGSIRVYAYGVRKFYETCGISFDLKSCTRYKAVMKALSKVSDPVKRVMPVTAEMVYLMLGLPLLGWEDEVFQVSVALGFFFLLRVGEIYETSSYRSSGASVRQLRMQDLEFTDANHRPLVVVTEADARRARFLHLNVHAAKNDQMWLGCLRLAEASGRAQDCVVYRAARFVALAKGRGQLPHEPLLQGGGGMAADDTWFRSSLKKVLGTLVLASGEHVDPSLFNTHSMRAGGATRLFNLGKRPEFIAMLGRWASDAVLNYIRTTDFELFHNVAAAMAF